MHGRFVVVVDMCNRYVVVVMCGSYVIVVVVDVCNSNRYVQEMCSSSRCNRCRRYMWQQICVYVQQQQQLCVVGVDVQEQQLYVGVVIVDICVCPRYLALSYTQTFPPNTLISHLFPLPMRFLEWLVASFFFVFFCLYTYTIFSVGGV